MNSLIKIQFSAFQDFNKKYFIMKNTLAHVLLIIFIVILLPACSVTQLNSDGDSSLIKAKHKEYFTQAISAMKAGESKKAQDLLINLINQQPNFSNAHVNLGIIFLNDKSYIEAENSFQKALKTNPENIYALNQLGILYRQQGNFSDSKSAYEKAIDIDSDYAFAHLNLGILYDLYIYNYPKAIESYKEYQALTKDKDQLVSKWIFDLERRNKKDKTHK